MLIKNNDGLVEYIEYLRKVPAVVTEVYEEKGSVFTKWSLFNIRIKNNANTVYITAVDEPVNKYESSFVILRDVDADKDGLCDFCERLYGTNPKKADSDGDGASDSEEIDEMGTVALEKDNWLQEVEGGKTRLLLKILVKIKTWQGF